MTDSTKRYHLRLTRSFGWYDTAKSQQWREWKLGALVAEAADIALLESIEGAPVERVELPADRNRAMEDPKLATQPLPIPKS